MLFAAQGLTFAWRKGQQDAAKLTNLLGETRQVMGRVARYLLLLPPKVKPHHAAASKQVLRKREFLVLLSLLFGVERPFRRTLRAAIQVTQAQSAMSLIDQLSIAAASSRCVVP